MAEAAGNTVVEQPAPATPEAQAAPLPAEKLDEAWEKVAKDKATAAPTQAGEEAAGPVVEEGATSDPLASLQEPARKLFEGMDARQKALEEQIKKQGQQLATAHGTIGNLKQRLDQSHVKLQEISPVVDDVKAKKEAEAAKAKLEKVERLKAERAKLMEYPDFPELLKHFDELLEDLKPAEQPKPKPAAAEEVKPATTAQPSDAEAIKIATLVETLTEQRPDWHKTRHSDEFKAWLPQQSDEIKAKFETNSVADAISVLDAFDKHKVDSARVASVEAERQRRLGRQETILPKGGAPGATDTSEDAIWKQAEKDRAARRAAGM